MNMKLLIYIYIYIDDYYLIGLLKKIFFFKKKSIN